MFQLDFDAIIGSSYESDIALDDLGYQEYVGYLSSSECMVTPSCADPSGKPTMPPTMPPTYPPYTNYPTYPPMNNGTYPPPNGTFPPNTFPPIANCKLLYCDYSLNKELYLTYRQYEFETLKTLFIYFL